MRQIDAQRVADTRYAEWKELPEDKRSALLAGIRDWVLGPYFGMALAIPVFVAIAYFTHQTFLFFAVLPIFSGGVRASARGRVTRLMDLPRPPTQFPVYVRLARGRRALIKYGHDEGVLSFVDGWLHFEGARTSFSLRHGGLGVQPLDSHEKLSKSNAFIFESSDDDQRFQVTVWSYNAIKNEELVETGLTARFREVLLEWIDRPQPRGGDICVYPPKDPSPVMVDQAWLGVNFGTFLSFLSLVFLFTCDQFMAVTPWTYLVALIMFVAGVYVRGMGLFQVQALERMKDEADPLDIRHPDVLDMLWIGVTAWRRRKDRAQLKAPG